MSSTDSDSLENVVDMILERVVGMARNEWTASIGIDSRHGPEHALLDEAIAGSPIWRLGSDGQGQPEADPNTSPTPQTKPYR